MPMANVNVKVNVKVSVLASLQSLLQAGGSLEADQVAEAVTALVEESVSSETKADFLIALADKGETPEEIAAFANELRTRAIEVPVDEATRDRGIVDIVGTGGDKVGTFNISTGAALLVSAAGVPVAKHGNRAITSPTGSADVLEALGIRVDSSPEEAAASLRDLGFVFLFAPRFHPAFKHIAPARKLCAERGKRTLFNLLGPLLNPARPSAQLMGVPEPRWCEPMALALRALGVDSAMVVCGTAQGASGLLHFDEISSVGPTFAAVARPGEPLRTMEILPADLGVDQACLADLIGGDRTTNARLIERLLANEERGPKRDAVRLNAAAALWTAGKALSIRGGLKLVDDALDSGAANLKLKSLATRIPA